MPLSPTQKKQVIKEYQTVDGDTGSPEVQIALLTTRVDRLTEHLKDHIHDVHSRRGLLSMIAKRRRLINFLSKVDKKRSKEIEERVGLGKKQSSSKVEKVEKTKATKKIAKKVTKTK